MEAPAVTIEEELQRLRVIAGDGTVLTAVELRFVAIEPTPRGHRRRIGARVWRLDTGEALRVIDHAGFLVVATGEFLEVHPQPDRT